MSSPGNNTKEPSSETPLKSDCNGTDSKQTRVLSTQECPPSPPIPPDGGYGWVIMIASFMASLILDGVCFSFGIFYMEFLEYYGASKTKTSWVGSVLNGMYLSLGPVVSGLSNKFGCRAVAITGSIMASASFILSTFSPNIDLLIFTYGALGGIGFGLMYLPAIVMVGFYFEKRRALATGVAVCGSGIGAFVFAPMCEKLLDVYDWKGATLIISGIVLNGCILGALYRPLEPPKHRPTITVEACHDDCIKTDSDSVGQCEDSTDAGVVRQRLSADPKPKDLLLEKVKNKSINPPCVGSLQNLAPTSAFIPPMACYSNSCCDIRLKQLQSDDDFVKKQKDLARPLYRKDIFYSGSVQHLAQYQQAVTEAAYIRSVTSIPEDKVVKSGWCSGVLDMCKSMTDTVREMMDFSLLKNPVFCIYGMSCFLCMAGFYIPFSYLPHHAIYSGLTRDQAAMLLSIIGIANTVARVLCGWISDQPWADCLIINNCALIMGGVATILCPFCFNYGLLATYSAVFGVGIAVFVSLRSIIMVELMGLEKLTSAFGLVTMCQGLSAFIGPPIAGALYNVMKSYNLSFYMAGTSLTLAGVICLPLRRIAKWQSNKALKKSEAENRNGSASNGKSAAV